MNDSIDTDIIDSIYAQINENEDNKVWKSGDCPEALGDSNLAHQHVGGATQTVDGVKDTVDSSDDNPLYTKKISETKKDDKKNQKKPGKSVNEQINNFKIMSNEPTNIFDKLYSTIMEGDDPFADLDSMGDDIGGDDMGDEELDLGGDEVTLSLPRDLAEKLCDALKEQLGEGDDEGDDFGDDLGDEGDDEMLGDSVVSEPDPKPLGGHGDRQHKDAGNTGAGSNKVNNPKSKSLGD